MIDEELDLIIAAKNAYWAYGEITDHKNYQGNPMPRWEELTEKIQAAWKASVKATQEYYGYNQLAEAVLTEFFDTPEFMLKFIEDYKNLRDIVRNDQFETVFNAFVNIKYFNPLTNS